LPSAVLPELFIIDSSEFSLSKGILKISGRMPMDEKKSGIKFK